MKKPKLLIIVLFQNLGDEEPYYATSPAPPLPGILVAGLTPDSVEVEVLHEMVRPIDYSTDAQFIGLSFMDYLAPHAYDVAARFRRMGKIVIAGGKFTTTHPDEVQPHFDTIVVGEAQTIWPMVVEDMIHDRLKPRYDAGLTPSLQNIPPPRYDLVEKKYTVPIVTEATRGCPHPCTYCALNIKRTPFRTRPIEDVVRDLTVTNTLPWHKRKMAIILDNNLGGDLVYAKELLREVAKLGFWAIGTQFSIECLRDDEFVDLLGKANCRMAFIGMESMNEKSLNGVQKRQNRVSEYKSFFKKLHTKGILTFTGLMFGLEEDTVEHYQVLPDMLEDVCPSVILPSISIPIYGTPWHQEVEAEGRITDRDLSHYEGDHVVFSHKHLTAEQIHQAYKNVNRIFYSWKNIFRRWRRILALQRREESWRRFLLKILIVTFVYFKLSYFQRHHARHRVFSSSAGASMPQVSAPARRVRVSRDKEVSLAA